MKNQVLEHDACLCALCDLDCIALLEELGPALRMPNGKSLEGGLFDLRDDSKDSKGRGFLFY